MTAIMIVCFVVALVVSVMFSGAEISIGSISRDSLQRMVDNDVRGASLVLKMIENKRRYHLMLISGRKLSVVGGTLFLYLAVASGCADWHVPAGFKEVITFILSFTAFILSEGVFGKLISLGEYESRVSRFAYFLAVFNIVLFPLTYFLDSLLSLFIKKNLELAEKEDDFIELVRSESESGGIEEEEKEMIESIIDFSETTVKEVMIPRVDVVAVEKGTGIDELIGIYKNEGHSRIPIYNANIDNILGVVYAKDLLINISEKGKNGFTVADIMRNAYFVTENKRIADLLKEFKKNKVHIAVVVDEYGGTAGIVALEDLIEEIVGEIHDEYDQDYHDYIWLDESSLLADAGLNIYSLNELIRTEIPSEDFDTLRGFIHHQLGAIPKLGVEFRWGNVVFKVNEIDGNKISKVLIKLEEQKQKESNDGE